MKIILAYLFLLFFSSVASAENLPKNAHKNTYSSGWSCDKGFKKSGNSCIAVKIPQNAKLTYLGNNWECKKGFKKTGNSCESVKLPKNATLSYLGNSWNCNKRFKKKGNACVEMSPQEIQKQQQAEKEVLAEMQRIKNSLSDGTIAFQTKIDSDTGDIIKLENGAIVEVSSYFGYLGYRKTAVLYGSGHRCNIWIAGKKSYKCELLKSPEGRGDPAKIIHISEVKENGTILFMLDGSMYEVDSIDEIYTSLWLGISDGLLINGATLINFDADEPVTVTRIK